MNDLATMIEEHPLATTIDYYASKLPENEKAISFLKSNRLASDATLKVGFADRTFGKQLPNHRTVPGRELRSALQKAGILKATGHETFRGFVTVPLSDANGIVTGVYGLRVDRKAPGEKRIAIGSGIFNAAALQSFGEIILCDSVLAAWTFYGSGYPYAVADVHGQLTIDDLSRVRRVLVVGDVDMRVLEGKEVLRIHFPDGVSVNEYAKDRHVSEDAFGIRIRAASWVGGHVDPQSASEKPATETSPLPTPCSDLHAESNEHETMIRIENRRWRIRGLDRNATIGVLKVNLMVLNETNDQYHVDSLDLYHARSRRVFLKEAADETAASEHELRSDLGRVLLKLEELQIEQLQRGPAQNVQVELSATERDEALSLLTDERLLDRILIDFETCGIVGEEPGKLAGYLAATSRLLDKPLGLVIQSSSAAGKSALADSVLRFMPPEEQFACSAMTSQSLYYLGNENLRHKILSVAEEEGVRDAAYQLKLLQSEGHLSLVSTSKESGSGRTTTERYEVDGPVALVMTTT
ncbi:hypothetical protein, partial [Novipirellula aureliae]|uniref:hypothetical protein n=1 Tax=Novipirellula aureliae TaxID=2527966 RepID=UPI0018CFC0B1